MYKYPTLLEYTTTTLDISMSYTNFMATWDFKEFEQEMNEYYRYLGEDLNNCFQDNFGEHIITEFCKTFIPFFADYLKEQMQDINVEKYGSFAIKLTNLSHTSRVQVLEDFNILVLALAKKCLNDEVIGRENTMFDNYSKTYSYAEFDFGDFKKEFGSIATKIVLEAKLSRDLPSHNSSEIKKLKI